MMEKMHTRIPVGETRLPRRGSPSNLGQYERTQPPASLLAALLHNGWTG
jgi:hypothetical protein